MVITCSNTIFMQFCRTKIVEGDKQNETDKLSREIAGLNHKVKSYKDQLSSKENEL